MIYFKQGLFIVLLAALVSCTKNPTCSDGIKNQNETGVDCGGTCPACATCVDGIKNQNETSVDCGGPCPACATCSDGIQNQGETDIDCGGPCGACPVGYPASDLYGANILSTDTGTTIITPSSTLSGTITNYSMSAHLKAGSSLKVITSFTITTPGGPNPAGWMYSATSNSGWSVASYDQTANTQQFVATGPSNAILSIFFMNHGYGRIDFYENGATTPTRNKYLAW